MRFRVTSPAGLVLLAISIACTYLAIPAQGATEGTDTLSLSIQFQQGSAEVDTLLPCNVQALNALRGSLSEGGQVVNADIRGYASPEGGSEYNLRLSTARAQKVAAWIRSLCDMDSATVTTQGMGVDWEGLRQQLDSVPFAWSDDVKQVLIDVPETTTDHHGRTIDLRKNTLRQLHGGKPYNELMTRAFPRLRRVGAKVTYTGVAPQAAAAQTSESNDEADAEPAPAVTYETTETYPNTATADEAKERYKVFAFRSNLLLPLLNVGAELPIGNR